MSKPDKNAWSSQLFNDLIEGGVTLFTHVPDAGHARLIELAAAHNDAQSVPSTSVSA